MDEKLKQVLARLDELSQDTPDDTDTSPLDEVIDHAERNAAAEAYAAAASMIREALGEQVTRCPGHVIYAAVQWRCELEIGHDGDCDIDRVTVVR